MKLYKTDATGKVTQIIRWQVLPNASVYKLVEMAKTVRLITMVSYGTPAPYAHFVNQTAKELLPKIKKSGGIASDVHWDGENLKIGYSRFEQENATRPAYQYLDLEHEVDTTDPVKYSRQLDSIYRCVLCHFSRIGQPKSYVDEFIGDLVRSKDYQKMNCEPHKELVMRSQPETIKAHADEMKESHLKHMRELGYDV